MTLLEQVRSNDELAWQQLVHLYGPLVHRWCKRSSLNDDDINDINDIFQETFHAVSRNLAKFSPVKAKGSFRSWLKTIVRTKIADHFRKLNNHAQGQGGTEAQLRIANLSDPFLEEDDDPRQEEDEQALVVQRAMELIKPEFSAQNWAAFEKVAMEGHSATEIAKSLNVNPQTIRQANYRIRRRLRGVLQDLVDEF
jgi:RNA polymerase sigma-70 factor (ECF subfamily)